SDARVACGASRGRRDLCALRRDASDRGPGPSGSDRRPDRAADLRAVLVGVARSTDTRHKPLRTETRAARGSREALRVHARLPRFGTGRRGAHPARVLISREPRAVGVPGFEPGTYSPPDCCATRLRYTPCEVTV